MLVTKRAVPLAVTSSDTNMKAITSKLNQTMVGHASRLSTRYIERTCLDTYASGPPTPDRDSRKALDAAAQS
jgi:hypothetical protein